MTSSEQPQFSEIDLQRMMADQATRAECGAQLHRRQSAMQNLMAKIHCLSDSEFEAAFGTLESLIENYNQKKLKQEKKPARSSEAHLDLTTQTAKK